MKKYIKITQAEKNRKFIEKSINLWGYKYDYSKVNYIDSTTPVIIIYRGVEYNQTPKKHLSKKSCELNVNRLSDEEFIRRSIEIWGDRFSYENMNYINTYSKVNLFDKLTGFHIEVKASSHLNGNYPSDTKDIFIKKSELLYDNKYDYSNISFKNMTTKIKIICPEHGEFEAYPYLHLTSRSGNICNKCSEFNTNKISKYLDKNNEEKTSEDLNTYYAYFMNTYGETKLYQKICGTPNTSKISVNIKEYLYSLGIDITQSNQKICKDLTAIREKYTDKDNKLIGSDAIIKNTKESNIKYLKNIIPNFTYDDNSSNKKDYEGDNFKKLDNMYPEIDIIKEPLEYNPDTLVWFQVEETVQK